MSRLKVRIFTLGCKVNQYESEAIAEILEKNGAEILKDGEGGADVCIVNTCSVTAESDRKCRQTVRRAAKENPGAVMIVAGCYPQGAPDKAAGIGGVDYIIGNRDKAARVCAEAMRAVKRKEGDLLDLVDVMDGACFENISASRSERARAYVKIEDGCSNRCAYCIIPRVRGKVRSRAPSDIIAEAKKLSLAGYREIVLTGIETSSYGEDLENGFSLADLTEAIDRENIFDRISFGSLEPSSLRKSFVDRISPLRSLTEHFHLSLQSGCDDTLKRMRRRYNCEIISKNVAYIRKMIPGATFSADIIVGFPGESDENFEKTMSFIDSLDLLTLHVFAYSRRPGTEADTMPDQIPESVKSERSARLIALGEKKRQKLVRNLADNGGVRKVLFESFDGERAIGRLNNYMEVSVRTDSDLSGKVLPIRIISSEGAILSGEIVSSENDVLSPKSE